MCYIIIWKNNDERHQALMRHLELHIKREPGVSLHSLGNWCLSSCLVPCWQDGCCDLVAKWDNFFLSLTCIWNVAYKFLKSSMTTIENSSLLRVYVLNAGCFDEQQPEPSSKQANVTHWKWQVLNKIWIVHTMHTSNPLTLQSHWPFFIFWTLVLNQIKKNFIVQHVMPITAKPTWNC